ncbi:Sterol 3-beta-glucosyltransferase UGT80B1 [Cladobotryum mycophilum]|uniref:Sterol 3-beta-glucosyltransferase UGT80B1 n=1 Tax=Cladobotryum mycophilum TaxID=491253 RepID=A0ABR0SL95_9HYPO
MAVSDEKQDLARQQASEPIPPYNEYENVAAEALVTDGFVIPDLEVPTEAPPAYGDQVDHIELSQPGLDAGAAVTSDGRVNISINQKNRRLAELLAPSIASQVAAQPSLPPAYIPPDLAGEPGHKPPPGLNVVIQIVGSRGDVQPFVALGKVLKETYRHRVRVATHPTFQTFVEENGLEFFSIGGDPAELMAFMVKHPGLMPGLDAITSGEISRRRKGVQDMLLGCWRSCIEAGNGLGPPPRAHGKFEPWDSSAGLSGGENQDPFVADAIIANPPSFAHIHIAEKLGIPLHMMFTMPWSPTRAFPHPLANVQSTNAEDAITNYLTYSLVEMMTWQGLGDVINRFREKALDLEPLALIWAPGLLQRLKISYTYCWSPALIPKPNDWGPHIDVAGFYFLNLASSYTPDPALASFLAAGPPPVYIGFGSIVVDDPNAMTRLIFDAIHLAGVRALVSKGWGGLGADAVGLPEGVFMLGNVPHDWLFERVSCVVHHGGAGTTAAGIKAGKPTLVVPFFGDQPFWGAMIAKAKAGPDPIPNKALTAEKLAEALKFCLRPETQEQAKGLGQKIREERGADAGAYSFHNHLNLEALRCSVAPSRSAAWRVRRTAVRLSPLAAAVLVGKGLVQYSDLKLYRSREYNTEAQPPDPITAGASSIMSDLSSIGMSLFADTPRDMFRKRRTDSQTLKDGDSRITKESSDAASRLESSSVLSPVISSDRNTPSTTSQNRIATPNTPQELPAFPPPPLGVPPNNRAGSVSPAPGRSSTPSNQSGPTRRDTYDRTMATFDATVGVSKNVGRVVVTGVKSPMNFCLGLAKGFRNLPRLYNDDTIRDVEKVTDLTSGVKVASKEFGLGFYDGVSGLVTQPLRGAQKDGVGGLVKGFGKGIGGLIAKPAAGIWGIPAYVMQGAYAEVNKFMARSVQNHVMTARVVQGQLDFNKASDGEKADIINRWSNDVRFDLKNYYMWKKKESTAEKAPAGSEANEAPSPFSRPQTGWRHMRGLSTEEKKRRTLQKKGYIDAPVPHPAGFSSSPRTSADGEYEEAIRASVRETSKGNAEEDAMIEAAIRDSVNAARQRGALPDPVRAPTDSKNPNLFEDAEYQITDEEYQELIEQAMRESTTTHGVFPPPQEAGVTGLGVMDTKIAPRGPDAGPAPIQMHNNDEDDELQRVIEESRKIPDPPPQPAPEEEDEELQRAIAASKDDMERAQHEKSEEEIVMEYVKKQSLAEEEFRRQQESAKGKGKAAEENNGGEDEEDDEEFRRAIEESLKLSSENGSGPSGYSG